MTLSLDKRCITLAALAAAGFSCIPALADITITAQEVAGAGQIPPVSQAVRLYYKESDARLEVSGEPTLVQDGKGNIVYGLDTSRKTYYVTVPTQEEPAQERSPGMDVPANEEVKLDLKETGQTMTFAGTTAHQYTVSGTVNYSRPQGQRRGGGGRRHRGGGGGGFGNLSLVGSTATIDQYGGGPGEGEGPRVPFSPAQWTISGEIWLSDAYKFPSKPNTVFAAQLAASASGPFQQPLADALDKHKGLPLLARITVTYIPASSAGKAINQYGGVIEGQRASTDPTTTVTTFTVKSVSDAPLSDTLFHAPLSYALVAAPLMPYVPGTPVSAPATP